MWTEQYCDLIASLNKNTTTMSPSRIRGFNQKMGWALWASKENTFFNSELWTKLNNLISTFRESAHCSWSAPIALLIQCEPMHVTLGDACLIGARWFSLPLQFLVDTWLASWEPATYSSTTSDRVNQTSFPSIYLNMQLSSWALPPQSWHGRIYKIQNLPTRCYYYSPTIHQPNHGPSILQASRVGKLVPWPICTVICLCLHWTLVPEQSTLMAKRISLPTTTLVSTNYRDQTHLWTLPIWAFPQLHTCRHFHRSPKLLLLIYSSFFSKHSYNESATWTSKSWGHHYLIFCEEHNVKDPYLLNVRPEEACTFFVPYAVWLASLGNIGKHLAQYYHQEWNFEYLSSRCCQSSPDGSMLIQRQGLRQSLNWCYDQQDTSLYPTSERWA